MEGENVHMLSGSYYVLMSLLGSVSMAAFVASNKVSPHFLKCSFV